MRDPVSLARVSTPALCAPPPWSSCFGHVRLRGEGSPPRHTQPCRVELVVAGSLVVVVIIVVLVVVACAFLTHPRLPHSSSGRGRIWQLRVAAATSAAAATARQVSSLVRSSPSHRPPCFCRALHASPARSLFVFTLLQPAHLPRCSSSSAAAGVAALVAALPLLCRVLEPPSLIPPPSLIRYTAAAVAAPTIAVVAPPTTAVALPTTAAAALPTTADVAPPTNLPLAAAQRSFGAPLLISAARPAALDLIVRD